MTDLYPDPDSGLDASVRAALQQAAAGDRSTSPAWSTVARRGRRRQTRRSRAVAGLGVGSALVVAAVATGTSRSHTASLEQTLDQTTSSNPAVVGGGTTSTTSTPSAPTSPKTCAEVESQRAAIESLPPVSTMLTIPGDATPGTSSSATEVPPPLPGGPDDSHANLRGEYAVIPGQSASVTRRIVEGTGASRRVYYELPADHPGSVGNPQRVGDWVYFAAWDNLNAPVSAIRRVPLNGGPAQDVVRDPEATTYAVSPDNTRLARLIEYPTNPQGWTGLAIRDLSTGVERRLPAVRSDRSVVVGGLVWDADSRHAFVTLAGAFSATDCRTGTHLDAVPAPTDIDGWNHLLVDDTGRHPARVATDAESMDSATVFPVDGAVAALVVHDGRQLLVLDTYAPGISGPSSTSEGPSYDLVDAGTGEPVPYRAQEIMPGGAGTPDVWVGDLGLEIKPA